MFNQLQKNIRKYFGISRTEANGLIVLILVSIILIISPLLYRHYEGGGYQNFEKDLALLDSLSDILWASNQGAVSDTSPVYSNLELFDPNDVSFLQMVRMGFDSILAKRVINYRNKGGIFHEPEDILKIYDFPETLYHRIDPFIRTPGSEKTLTGNSEPKSMVFRSGNLAQEELKKIKLDLNKADSSQLILIRGIGPVFSSRIIKYRNLLGGYLSTAQLSEVYGLKDETLLHLKECVFIDSLFEPERIRVNFSEWEELVRHPYIHSALANRILKIRSVDGPYLDADDFALRLEIPDSLGINLMPYLEF